MEEKGKLKETELIAFNYGFCMAQWQTFGKTLDPDKVELGGFMMTKICNIMCERLGIEIDKDYEGLVKGLQDIQVANLFTKAMDQIKEEREEKQ